MSWSLFNRSWVLYVGLLLFIWFSPNHVKLLANAKAESLSRLTPVINYKTAFVDIQDHFDPKKLEDCIYYHRKVVEIIPSHRADAYAMLGFCYERAGQNAKAVGSYERSLKYNPSFFWTYYNLGTIYYNQKKYEKARYYFERATEQDPIRASMIPTMSKVYKDVGADFSGSYDIAGNLAQGYQRAFILLVVSAQQMHDYPFMLAASLQAARRERAGDDIFFYYAGVAAYEMRMFDKAIVLLQRYLSAVPAGAEGMHYLGLALQGMGQQRAGEELLKKAERLAIQNGPSLPDVSHVPAQFF